MASTMLNSANCSASGAVKFDYVGLKSLELLRNVLCVRPGSIKKKKKVPRKLAIAACDKRDIVPIKIGMSDEECEAAVVAGNIPVAPPIQPKPAAPAGTLVVPSLPLSHRPRQNLRSLALRAAFQETSLSPANLNYPLLIHEDMLVRKTLQLEQCLDVIGLDGDMDLLKSPLHEMKLTMKMG